MNQVSSKKTRLIVVDLSNFIFRAFYAIRSLNSPEGVPVNAVHGVLSMLLKLFSTYRPTHVIIARDTSGGSFRNELYDQYKANRSAPPEDLVPQFALILKLVEEMGLQHVANDKYEADDLIGSICVQWKDEYDEIYIASGDKDLMQFIGHNVYMLDTMKDKLYDSEAVFEKMGVRPDQIVDYLSMVGDASDNIPGMKGIGAKGAAKLLGEHDTLEKCIEVKDTFKGKKLTNAFENHIDDALMSKDLVQIVTDILLESTPEKTLYQFYPSDQLISYLKSLGFKSAIKKLEDMKFDQHRSENPDENSSFTDNTVDTSTSFFDTMDLVTLNSKDALNKFLEILKLEKSISYYIQYSSDDPIESEVLAISMRLQDHSAYYIPFAFDNELEKLDIKTTLGVLWSDEDKNIISSHGQNDFRVAKEMGIVFESKIFILKQAHFVLDPASKHNLDALTEKYLDTFFTEFKELKKIDFLDWDNDSSAKALCERVYVLSDLKAQIIEELKEHDLLKVYDEIDSILTPILADIETNGVMVNTPFWDEMAVELSHELETLTVKINNHSENEINLNSPKQIAVFLFEELALPVVKKTKTGFSTDVSVLEDLAARNISEVPSLILKYRELQKIHSTYVQALPKLQNLTTKRIHTHFNQDVAATGRLSSDRPNLQNIPIRTPLGRKVRKGFIAKPGHVLLAADYSQVELRILAHLSKDDVMVSAFLNNEDIHSQTASQVLGVKLEDVTKDQRSSAKAVNFGLMYGQSSFGLAKSLGISRTEAKEYITTYFDRFSKVKSFLDSLKESCEETGYAQTVFGRKRYLSDIYSKNRNIKANAERIAINSPIQGTAADIVKLAMIKIDQKMKNKHLSSKMILQVHDELIFEVPENEIETMEKLVRDGMENVVKFSVPLKVDMGIGVNWFDLK